MRLAQAGHIVATGIDEFGHGHETSIIRARRAFVAATGSAVGALVKSGEWPGRSAGTLLQFARRADIIGITASQPRFVMADFVLRNLDQDLKERLRRSAAAHRRSMNAELREIVRQALDGTPTVDAPDLRQLAAEIRALSQGRAQTPSEALLREGRDER